MSFFFYICFKPFGGKLENRKKYFICMLIFGALSVLSIVGPCGYGLIAAFITGTAVVSKLSISMAALGIIILGVVCIIQKHRPRCIPWIVVILVFFFLSDILPIIIALSIGIVLDEFCFTPLTKLFYKLWLVKNVGN